MHLHNASEQRAKVQSIPDEAVRADDDGNDDDDFGDFAAAGSPAVITPAVREDLPSQIYRMPGSRASLAHANAATRHASGSPQRSAAAALPPEKNAGDAQLLPERSAPIPMDFFGEEDDFEDEAKLQDPAPWYSKPDFPYVKQGSVISGEILLNTTRSQERGEAVLSVSYGYIIDDAQKRSISCLLYYSRGRPKPGVIL